MIRLPQKTALLGTAKILLKVLNIYEEKTAQIKKYKTFLGNGVREIANQGLLAKSNDPPFGCQNLKLFYKIITMVTIIKVITAIMEKIFLGRHGVSW